MERTTVHWVLTVVCTCISVMQLSSAAPTLGTCGQPTQDVCSYFFNALELAFVNNSDVPYALQRAFFPTGTISPLLLDVHTTVTVTNIPSVQCTDEDFQYRSSSIHTLPPVDQLCINYNCTSMTWRWTHQWSQTVINFVIGKENLDLLQDVNFIAYATAAFNSFDTGTLINFLQGSNTRENSTSSEVRFSLIIPSLHCIPSEDALLEAWGDIVPWVSHCKKHLLHTPLVGGSMQPRSSRRQIYITIPHINMFAVSGLEL